MKHSPGPWVVYNNDDAKVYREANIGVYSPKANNDVAYCDIYGIPQEDRLANAALLSAAPELLEALERYVRYADNHHRSDVEREIDEQARISIAKAKGETP